VKDLRPYSLLLKRVLLPIASLMKGMNVMSCLRELERTQWYSKEQIEQLQARRLHALLEHAYRNVPYYHRMFKMSRVRPTDIRGPGDLRKLPILNKEDVRNHLSELVATNYPRKRLSLMSTSGSTGQPLKFYHDNSAKSYIYAANIRSNSWAGLEYGDKYARFTGSPFDSGIRAYERICDVLTRRVASLPSYDITEARLFEYVQKIRRSKPKAIIGYASALYLLGSFVKDQGISDVTVGTVISSSEQLWRRELIEETFHSKVFDNYSSREFAIAAQCEMRGGYHILSELILLEFVKGNEGVSTGEVGEILVTDLTNYGMPFIRYRIGDLGRPCEDLCSCGRGLPLIESIEGRSMDYITTCDGRILSGGNLTMLFKDLRVRQFQVHQKARTKVVVRVVRAPGYSREDSEKIVSGMKRLIGPETNVELILQESIDMGTISGKRRFIMSDISTGLIA